MRVALLTNTIFPLVVGGMQKHSYYLAKYLARHGAYVDLYYTHAPAEGSSKPKDGLCFGEEQGRICTHSVERARVSYFPGHYLYECYLNSKALFKAFQERPDVDFIYAQGFSGWKALNEKQRGAELPPIGVNLHGLNMYQKPASLRSWLVQWMFRPFVQMSLRKADVGLSLGGGISSIVRSLGQPRIVESPNGVEGDWLTSEVVTRHDPLTFIFIGRYERVKGIQELHQVIRGLEDVADFRFHFIGPIPERLRVSSEKTTYWGLIKSEEKVKALLRQSDVLVCPSYSEGMPTVILEAMASGLAVIATKVGAVDAMVSDENGWLIPPGNVEALKQAMVEAIDLPETELQRKKERGRELVEEQFLWDAVAQRTLDGIAAVL